MPSLFSTRVTVIPGVWCSTTNGLIPARPALRSSVAQTTTKPSDFSADISPAVQKILVPSRMKSSPSRVAVVVIAAESEPHPGSVIAIAPHLGLPCAAAREAFLLLRGAGGRDRRAAQARIGYRQEQPGVAPAQFLGAEHGAEDCAISGCRRTFPAPSPARDSAPLPTSSRRTAGSFSYSRSSPRGSDASGSRRPHGVCLRLRAHRRFRSKSAPARSPHDNGCAWFPRAAHVGDGN